ncbi:unnamed protein product [Cunninghamella blakesleeana]
MEFSNRFTPDEPAFWRVCDDQKCHCDFRLTISHCEESRALLIVNILDIIWSVIATIIACSILYHRLYYLNQQIFDYSGTIPRPKPIESMGLFGIFFNVFRLTHASILISDVAKSAMLRSFLFEFPWQMGIAALTCYLFGVVHTLANSSSVIYMSWVKSQMFVDMAFITIIIIPFLTINPLSITAGHYADQGDLNEAIAWTETIYYLWLIYTFVLGSLVLIAGLRLLSLLKKHLLTKNNGHRENTEKMKNGARKVKVIITIGCFCLWTFSIMIAIYATSRHSVMLDPHFSVVLAALALFNGPFATSVIEISLLTEYQIFNGLSNLSFGTMNGSSQLDDLKDSHQYSITSFSQEVNSLESTVQILGKEKNQMNVSQKSLKQQHLNNHDSYNDDLNKDDQDDIEKNKRKNSNGNNKSIDDSFSLSSNQSLVKPLSLDPIYSYHHHHHTNSYSISHTHVTNLEQDQLNYNAMTNQLRLPPSHHSSDPHRHHHVQRHQ